jgi:hypothetical protein
VGRNRSALILSGLGLSALTLTALAAALVFRGERELRDFHAGKACGSRKHAIEAENAGAIVAAGELAPLIVGHDHVERPRDALAAAVQARAFALHRLLGRWDQDLLGGTEHAGAHDRAFSPYSRIQSAGPRRGFLAGAGAGGASFASRAISARRSST